MSVPSDAQKMKTYTFRMPAAMHEAIVQEAQSRRTKLDPDCPTAAVVRDALKEYLEKRQGNV